MDYSIIDNLKKLSIKSEMLHKHSAALIIPKEKKIIFGINSRTHFGSIHAEMDVLFQKRKKYKDAYLVVIRTNSNGKLQNSKPCKACTINLKKYNIKKIFYSNCNGGIVCENTNDISTSHISSGNRGWKKLI
jgi:hypothetical protein